jgi:hypothetical protein
MAGPGRYRTGKPTFTVYGRRQIGKSESTGRSIYTSLTKEGLWSQAAAQLWLMDHILEKGASQIDAVIVRLDHGVDVNGERHVVKRIGEGKAWWE